MTRQETLDVLAYLAARYPSQSKMTPTSIGAYLDDLADFPPQLAVAAAKRLARTSEFFPSVPALIREIVRLEVGLPEPEQAWSAVLEANAANDFDELPEASTRSLAAAGGTWALRNEPAHHVRRAFLESYRAEVAAIETVAREVALPAIERARLEALPPAAEADGRRPSTEIATKPGGRRG